MNEDDCGKQQMTISVFRTSAMIAGLVVSIYATHFFLHMALPLKAICGKKTHSLFPTIMLRHNNQEQFSKAKHLYL